MIVRVLGDKSILSETTTLRVPQAPVSAAVRRVLCRAPAPLRSRAPARRSFSPETAEPQRDHVLFESSPTYSNPKSNFKSASGSSTPGPDAQQRGISGLPRYLLRNAWPVRQLEHGLDPPDCCPGPEPDLREIFPAPGGIQSPCLAR